MTHSGDRSGWRGLSGRCGLVSVFLLLFSFGCTSTHDPTPTRTGPVVLRIGVGNVASGNPLGGMRQVAGNQVFEGLVRIGPDGRPRAWLAKNWKTAGDGRSITLDLRSDAKFHDGTPVTAALVVQALQTALPDLAGPVFQDIKAIDGSADGKQVIIRFNQPSPFLLEALEAVIKKPGAPTIGTGAFMAAGSSNELHANVGYYLGRPVIDQIAVTTYPTIRAAWADMLRNKIDMLYEVGADATSSMQDAKTVSTFSFPRSYQFVVLLNVQSPKFRAREVRRALNAAIDREAIVRDAFDGHAAAATGLVWPQNWAAGPDLAKVKFDPAAAASTLKSTPPLTFTCLVPTDYERVALVVQQQLAAVGVNMQVEPVAPDAAFRALRAGSFDAVLTDIVGGPSLLRTYIYWDTHSTLGPGSLGSPDMDAALDRIRHAPSESAYRTAVANFQQVVIENPQAIFLAWGERSRAVSKRFEVPVGEPGRDVLSTLRLWKPSTDAQNASRN